MNPIHEGGVIPHLRRQRAQKMRDALLLLNIDVEVADHDDAAVSADLILAAAELARRHVALHDVHAVLLIEGDAGDLVEADDVVLADQAALASGVVDEHLGDGRLAAGDQVGVRRDLLKQMALARASGPKLDEVVVPLDERNHAQKRHALGPLVEMPTAPDRLNEAGGRSTPPS